MDCAIYATYSLGAVTISTMQDQNTPLRLCGAEYMGFASLGHDTSSNFGDVSICSIGMSSFGARLPITAEFVDETPNPNGQLPLQMNDPWDKVVLHAQGMACEPPDSFPSAAQGFDDVIGFGKLCAANGPAALLTLDNGVTLLRQLTFFQANANSQKYLCVPNVPLEKCANGCTTKAGFGLFNTYIPVNSDGTLTLALSSAPDTNLVLIDLNNLPPCSGASAPSLSEGKLIGLTIILLLVGTWSLSRRSGFRSLSMP